MQEALLPPANPDRLRSPFDPKSFAFPDQRLSSPKSFAFPDQRLSSPMYLNNGDDLFYGYSPFSPRMGLSSPSPRATSSSLSPSSSASLVDDGDEAVNAAATDNRLHLARLALQYQEVANRYELCLAHLADTADEAAALRRENAELRLSNSELARRMAILGGKQSSSIAIADELRRLRLGEQQPAPVDTAAKERHAPVVEKPAVLPKSISIRSSGYLKMNQDNKLSVSKPANVGSQRVIVDMGGKKGEEQKGAKKEQLTGGLEFEVYNQGMFKTELCNKWEETGTCPYGDQCQFAHGIAELRPVIRHPRYKTEVCRMVLAGDVCPYGHRCHFRHALTPSDRLLLRP